jgi:hypothetical protein
MVTLDQFKKTENELAYERLEAIHQLVIKANDRCIMANRKYMGYNPKLEEYLFWKPEELYLKYLMSYEVYLRVSNFYLDEGKKYLNR